MEIIYPLVSFSIILIILALVIKDRPKKTVKASMEIEEKKGELNDLIEEADKMIKELHDFSEYIIKEMESKHKEMLFLYQLIEDKSKEVNQKSKESMNPIHQGLVREKAEEKNEMIYSNKNETKHSLDKIESKQMEQKEINERDLDLIINNFFNETKEKDLKSEKEPPKNKDYDIENEDKNSKIIRMQQQGYTIDEIAKNLNIGKGEVQLIIGMNKKR